MLAQSVRIRIVHSSSSAGTSWNSFRRFKHGISRTALEEVAQDIVGYAPDEGDHLVVGR